MTEKIPAMLLALVCLLLLARLCLSSARRHRVDMVLRRMGQGVRRVGLRAWRWPASRRQAGRMADETIRRAQGRVAREGNVYRPDSFRTPGQSRKPDKFDQSDKSDKSDKSDTANNPNTLH